MMSGRVITCHRYYDGLCDGGPCEECKHDPVNARARDKAKIIRLEVAGVCLIVALALVVVLA